MLPSVHHQRFIVNRGIHLLFRLYEFLKNADGNGIPIQVCSTWFRLIFFRYAFYLGMLIYHKFLKVRYCEKAQRFEKITHHILTSLK